MLNPLLHPNHSSAPTSPVCTRSVLSGRRSNNFVFGGNGSVNTAPHSPLVGFHSTGSSSALAYQSSSIHNPVGFVKPVLLRAVPGSVLRRRKIDIQHGASQKQRRLSRIVKSRTLDFTEFPEGMREYPRAMFRTASTESSSSLSPTRNDMRNRGGRTILRETCSQPVSPQLIPRIEIHDLCDFSTGSEPPPTPPSKRTQGEVNSSNHRISSRVVTVQRKSHHQEEERYNKPSTANKVTSIPISQQDHVSGGNLSHQLSTGSAVSLPSKIDNIGSDEDQGNTDDPEYEINDEDEDDYDDGFTAYDDEEYNSEGESRSRSAGGVLNDGVEYSHINSNGRKSPNRKLGQRNNKVLSEQQSTGTNGATNHRRRNKVKRRKAYYSRQRRTDIAGRSKSLTSIDSLSPHTASTMNTGEVSPRGSVSSRGQGGRTGSVSIHATKSTGGMERGARSEDLLGGTGNAESHRAHLSIPIRAGSEGGVTRTVSHSSNSSLQRRRKLSTASKVSSNEFFTVSFECLEPEKGPEEFVPATRGTCLREAISAVCDRRGVDVESINVYLDQSRTPLPLLTSETSWLGGRHIQIRAKDESKSPVRSSGRISVTAPPSRKTSTANNSYRSKSRLFTTSTSGGSGEDNLVAPNTPSNQFQSSSYLSQHSPALCVSTLMPTSSSTLQPSPCGPLPSSSPFGVIGSTNVGTVGNQSGAGLTSSPSLNTNSASAAIKGKHPNRWSGLWGLSAKDNKMDALVQQLDSYSRLGIPKLQHCSVKFEAEDAVEEALYSLEEDWTDVVGHESALSLDEKTRSQQTALWELVETEVAYIRTLKVIQDLFLNCLCNLQNNHILTEIDVEKLFCNIPEIYAANRVFWFEYIIPMLKASRDAVPEGKPLDPTLLQDGFLRFEEIFKPYSRYCSEQTNCQEYCREQDRTNEIFKAYLAWCETQKDCNRLRLIDILVRPMQRLTKYSLLLKAILKKTEDEEQRRILISMDKKVDSFVTFVNSQLRQRQENERLKTIIARIESYDPVETRDEDLERLISAHCRLDLTSPMPGCTDNQRRHLLFEGDLKLKEGSTKMDVHVFLFSDMLLLCKNLTKIKGDKGSSGGTGHHYGPATGSANPYGPGTDAKVKVIRQPYVIDRLVVVDISKDGHSGSQGHSGPGGLALAYLNEYSIVSAAFTLHSSEIKIIKVWKEQIQKAKDLYEEAKAASASQIDRFYLSACGGYAPGSTGLASEKNVNTYAAATCVVGDADQDSDQDFSFRSGGMMDRNGGSCLLSAAAASMGGLAAATVRRSSFQGCGNGNTISPQAPNNLTAMFSHPGSVDVLDGTTSSGFGNEHHLTHQNSANTLSPYTIAKHSKALQTQHSYQGTLPGYSHSRTASMTASMEALRASSQSSEENYCPSNKNVHNKATAYTSSPSSSRENIGPNSPNTKMSVQIQLLSPQQGPFSSSPKADRADQTIARSSTPNKLSVQIPGTGNSLSKTTVNASHSMPNVSDGQVNGSNIIYQKSLESKYSIDVSVEDASEYKRETEKSHRAPSLKSPSKGASYPPLSPKSLKRASRLASQQSGTCGGISDATFSAPCSQEISSVSSQNNYSRKPGLRHQMATVQSEGTYTNSSHSPQIIPVITTGGSDDSDTVVNKKNNSKVDNSPTNVEPTSTFSNNTSPATGMRSVARCRQGGRSGTGHADRRYHTTGVIEDIKKQDGDGELIHKRLSLNYGKHINQSTGGDKLKIKGDIVSEGGIDLENATVDTTDASQTSTSTSGVSSACSGSLQHLSVGGITSDVIDTNASMVEKGDIIGLSPSSSGTSSLGSTSSTNQPTAPASTIQPASTYAKNITHPLKPTFSGPDSNTSGRSSTYIRSSTTPVGTSISTGLSNGGVGMNTEAQRVPPPIPPRGNRDKDSGQHQGTNISHVSTTYIGGTNADLSTSQSNQEMSMTREIKKGSTKSIRDEVTIGNQSTHSSQVSVTNKKKSLLKQTGLQLKISINSSLDSSVSPTNTSSSTKEQSVAKLAKLAPQPTSSSSNKTDGARASKSSKDGPKIKKLRDLLLSDSDVESSNV